MAWIKSNEEIATHPKVRRAARLLNVSVPTMIGHLHIFWWWCLKYAQDGDLTRYEWQDIAEGAGWEGDPDLFLKALTECGYGGSHGFVERTENGLLVHDWMEYAGKLIDNRQANAERMRKARGKGVQRTCDAQGEHVQLMCDARTGARVDKSRVESITDDDDNARARARDDEGLAVFADTEVPEMTGERPTKESVQVDDPSESVETEVSVCCINPLSGERLTKEPAHPDSLSIPDVATVSPLLLAEKPKCMDTATELLVALETKMESDHEPHELDVLQATEGLGDQSQAKEWISQEAYSQKGHDSQEIIAFAEMNFGRMLSPSEIDDVLDWCTQFRVAGSPMPETLVCEGLKRCAEQNQRKVSYLRGIMSDWLAHGVMSLADITARDEEWSAQKERLRSKRRDPPESRTARENGKGVTRDAQDKRRPRYDDAASYDPSAWERAGFAVSS
ncbi:replication initiation and membrane attachment [Peptococcaceae bacterium CEB3]|nr:replication initiation and membrane attachment [Peptococcaceae bacterium CEB3]